eukprot:scaffold9594_cov56-Phaeocystis_antarctica.AAC.2
MSSGSMHAKTMRVFPGSTSTTSMDGRRGTFGVTLCPIAVRGTERIMSNGDVISSSSSSSRVGGIDRPGVSIAIPEGN